jgi:hypothetical protein
MICDLVNGDLAVQRAIHDRRCPQCESRYCGAWCCRFSGIPNNEYMASQSHLPPSNQETSVKEGYNPTPIKEAA